MVYLNRTAEELAYLDSMDDSDRPDSPPPANRGETSSAQNTGRRAEGEGVKYGRRPVSARSKGAMSDECSLYGASTDIRSKRGRPIWEGGPISEDRYLEMQAEVFRLKMAVNHREDQHKQLLVRLAHAEDTVKRQMRDDIQQNCVASKAKYSAIGRINQQYVAIEKVRELEQKLRDQEREAQKRREHIRYYKDQNLTLKKQLEETMRRNWSAHPSSASRGRDSHMVQRLKEEVIELRSQNEKLKVKLTQYEKPAMQSGATLQTHSSTRAVVDEFRDFDAKTPTSKQEVEILPMYKFNPHDENNSGDIMVHEKKDIDDQSTLESVIADCLMEGDSKNNVKKHLLDTWAKMENLNKMYQSSMEELELLKVNHERALQKLHETNTISSMNNLPLDCKHEFTKKTELVPTLCTSTPKSTLSNANSTLSTPKSLTGKIRHMLSHQRKNVECNKVHTVLEDMKAAKNENHPITPRKAQDTISYVCSSRSQPSKDCTTSLKGKMIDETGLRTNGLICEKTRIPISILIEDSEIHYNEGLQNSITSSTPEEEMQLNNLLKHCQNIDIEANSSVGFLLSKETTISKEVDEVIVEDIRESIEPQIQIHQLVLETDRTWESIEPQIQIHQLILETDRTWESDRTADSECTFSEIEEPDMDTMTTKKLQSTIAMEPNNMLSKDDCIILTIRCLQLQPEHVDPCIQTIFIQFDFLSKFCNKSDQCTPSVENMENSTFYLYSRAFSLPKKHEEARKALRLLLESEVSIIPFQVIGKNELLNQQHQIGTSEVNLHHVIQQDQQFEEITMELDVTSVVDNAIIIGKLCIVLQGLQFLRCINNDINHGEKKYTECF